MVANSDIYASIQEHLERSRLNSTANHGPVSVLPPTTYTKNTHDQLVTHQSSSGAHKADMDEDFERYSAYNFPDAPGHSSAQSLHEPEYLLPSTTEPRFTVNGDGWGMSDVDLPLKHDPMILKTDKDEEVDVSMNYDPIYPNAFGSSRIHLMDGDNDTIVRESQRGRFTWSNRDKLNQRVHDREHGVGRQAYPYLTWLMSFGIVAVFVAELILSKERTGEAIQIHPSVQPMLGPPAEFLISFGARFVPCMRSVPGLPPTNMIPCLKESTSSQQKFMKDQMCSLAHICGLDDPKNPNQGYRFVSAIFVHAGIVHILFNLIVLLTLCCQIEKLIGTIAYAIVFMAGGIGGNLLGGNFGLIGQPALGASGAVYTCISFEMIDLIYNWKYEIKPKTRLTVSIIFAVLGLALGLLPGLDNFSHIGGFCVGILGGMVFAPSIHSTKTHMFINWLCRLIGMGLLIAFIVALVLNFYRNDDPATACKWCRYLSCLPMFDACRGYGTYYELGTCACSHLRYINYDFRWRFYNKLTTKKRLPSSNYLSTSPFLSPLFCDLLGILSV